MRYEHRVESYEIVVVAAGSAGLATAALLQRDGLRPLVLEAGPEPGAAWRERYDRLRLHTASWRNRDGCRSEVAASYVMFGTANETNLPAVPTKSV